MVKSIADSIRIKYKIPEFAYAVLSSDTIFEIRTSGVQRVNSSFQAKLGDRFHIGSNTKAITSFIAALLVEQGKIKWNTKIFDLFPELKINSKLIYDNVTLQDLLTFRGKLPSYSYGNEEPARAQITGDNAHQRYLLMQYFLSQQAMEEENGLTASNADYVVAGLMLEKASKKSYKTLVMEFGESVGITFGFDYPNRTDVLQPWGHDSNLQPLAPFDQYKLNWLLSAGNINVSLPDYIKFIQLLLKGLRGESEILSHKKVDQLLYGCPVFSFGWFNEMDKKTKHHIAYNQGNAGAFITEVHLIKESNRAYVIFTNAATSDTEKGIAVLLDKLEAHYGR